MQSLGPLLPAPGPAQVLPAQVLKDAPPPPPERWRAWRQAWVGDLDWKAAVICATAAAAYTVSHFEGSIDFYNRHFGQALNSARLADILGDLYWLATSNLLFGVFPLLVLLVLREPLAEYGLGLGDRRTGFTVAGLFLLVMLPVTYLASQTASFRGTYPLNSNAARDPFHFVAWEILYVGYFAGWEFFHRSFLLFGLRRRIGNLAVFVVALPFMLEHFGKPEPEAWGSFVAAVALGFLAIRARSFWYGFFIHGGVALFMDVVQSWKRLTHG